MFSCSVTLATSDAQLPKVRSSGIDTTAFLRNGILYVIFLLYMNDTTQAVDFDLLPYAKDKRIEDMDSNLNRNFMHGKISMILGLSHTTPDWVHNGLLFTSDSSFSYTTLRQSEVLRWA